MEEKRIERFPLPISSVKVLKRGDNMYTPQPIDTKSIELSEELKELTEKLAENVHENWAIGRLKEGWTFGKERNDALKQTPCLVPYNELPESEKEYDRNTAVETVKVILAMGFNIEKQ